MNIDNEPCFVGCDFIRAEFPDLVLRDLGSQLLSAFAKKHLEPKFKVAGRWRIPEARFGDLIDFLSDPVNVEAAETIQKRYRPPSNPTPKIIVRKKRAMPRVIRPTDHNDLMMKLSPELRAKVLAELAPPPIVERSLPLYETLRRNGETNPNNLACALNALFTLATDDESRMQTVAEAELLLLSHPKLNESILRCARIKAMPSVMAAQHYIGAVIQGKTTQMEAFVVVLMTGHAAYPGCPAHALRERVINGRYEKGIGLIRLVAYAWDMFSKGEVVKKSLKAPLRMIIPGWNERVLLTSSIVPRSPRSRSSYLSL